MSIALVLSGGSTKIPLHVGAYKAIEEQGIKIDSVYANSAGSIIGACIAVGYSSSQLIDLVYRTNFNKLIHQSWYDKIINVLFDIGLVPGKRIYEFLEKNLFGKRFKDLVGVDLNLIGHCLEDRSYKVFNKKNYPDLKLSLATRASSSVPLLFQPVVVDDKHFVDGGISKDYPVDLVPKDKTYIGHLIESTVYPSWESKSILKFGISLIDQLIHANVSESMIDAHSGGLTVVTHYDKDISDFEVKNDEKSSMILLGYENMKKALSQWNGQLL